MRYERQAIAQGPLGVGFAGDAGFSYVFRDPASAIPFGKPGVSNFGISQKTT